MSENARDTQFAGFAERLWKDIASSLDLVSLEYSPKQSVDEYIEQIIARRAYDLAQHTVGYCLEYLHECGFEMSGRMNNRIQPSIPDMTKWPEVEQ